MQEDFILQAHLQAETSGVGLGSKGLGFFQLRSWSRYKLGGCEGNEMKLPEWVYEDISEYGFPNIVT